MITTLYEMRKARNLSQKQCAEFIGMSVKTYRSYEKGITKPTSETVGKLAKLFNVTVIRITSAVNNPDADEIKQQYERFQNEVNESDNKFLSTITEKIYNEFIIPYFIFDNEDDLRKKDKGRNKHEIGTIKKVYISFLVFDRYCYIKELNENEKKKVAYQTYKNSKELKRIVCGLRENNYDLSIKEIIDNGLWMELDKEIKKQVHDEFNKNIYIRPNVEEVNLVEDPWRNKNSDICSIETKIQEDILKADKKGYYAMLDIHITESAPNLLKFIKVYLRIKDLIQVCNLKGKNTSKEKEILKILRYYILDKGDEIERFISRFYSKSIIYEIPENIIKKNVYMSEEDEIDEKKECLIANIKVLEQRNTDINKQISDYLEQV